MPPSACPNATRTPRPSRISTRRSSGRAPPSTATSATRRPDGIAKITIDRPEVRNAFRPQTLVELRDAFEPARDDTRGRRDRLHRRGRRGLLLGRRPADPRRRRLHRRRRGRPAGRRPPRRRRPARADPPPAEAGGRDGRRLRGRRRPHPARLVCDLTIAADNARFGQTGPRVGCFDGGFGACLLARIVGDQEGEGVLVPLPPVRRRGGAARWASSTRSSRSTSSSGRRSPGAARCSHLSPFALRLLKASFNADEDGSPGCSSWPHDATLLFYMHRGGAGGAQRLPGEAPARLLASSRRAAHEDLADGRAAADAAGGDRAGAGRDRGRGRMGRGAAAARCLRRRPGRLDLHPDRDQPRQRLLGRQARRRHGRPAGAGAGDLGRAGDAAAGAGRDLGRVRGRRRLRASTWPSSPGS